MLVTATTQNLHLGDSFAETHQEVIVQNIEADNSTSFIKPEQLITPKGFNTKYNKYSQSIVDAPENISITDKQNQDESYFLLNQPTLQ